MYLLGSVKEWYMGVS